MQTESRDARVTTTIITSIVAASVATGSATAELVYGVTLDQTLVTFDSGAPGTLGSGMPISGLAAGESVRGIDFRPATGELYATGSFSTLYRINVDTGVATAVGAPFAPGLNGSSFGFDFNPVIDRIRSVSDADQNLVLNPDTGTGVQVTPLFYGAGDVNFGLDPNIVGSAYTNSFDGATSTQLFGIDTGLDTLVMQDNSNGTLTTVGSLGVDLTDQVGFDISGRTGTAFASVVNSTLGSSTFWTIDLETGNASMIGEIGGGALVGSIAVVPAPGVLPMLGFGFVAGRRRRRH